MQSGTGSNRFRFVYISYGSGVLRVVVTLFSAAILALADGTLFRGFSIGAPGAACGEVVFNTAITGYQEILTDPSYSRQIVALTYPHIGNVGCNAEDFESGANYATGLVIRDLPLRAENWRMQDTLPDYLQKHGVVAIAGIDTRKRRASCAKKGSGRLHYGRQRR